MSMKEKMHTGELYLPNGEEIMNEQLQRLERLYDFNATRPLEQEKRTALLKEMFAVRAVILNRHFTLTLVADMYILGKIFMPISI
jgi:hypothetical protein